MKSLPFLVFLTPEPENGTVAFPFSPLSGPPPPTPLSSAFCRVHVVGSFVVQIQ